MTRKTKERLAAIEGAAKDGQGELMFVTHEEDGRFRDAQTGRMYSAERLKKLHDSRPNFVIINQGGPGSTDLPVHPAGNPIGRTLDDVHLYNAITGKQYNGEPLTAEEKAFLTNWEVEGTCVQEAHDEWEAESQPQFDETVRRMDWLDARAQARRKR